MASSATSRPPRRARLRRWASPIVTAAYCSYASFLRACPPCIRTLLGGLRHPARTFLALASLGDRAGLRRWASPFVTAALIAACAAPKPAGPLLLHPVPPTLEGYALEQGALVFSGPEFMVSARPWDYRLVAEELRRSGEPSPFGDGDEAAGAFLFLRVRLENRSARTLVFNPLRASLLRRGDAPLLPLEHSDLFVFAGERIADAEARARTFRKVSFDAAAAVRPGQSLERYLVFRAPAAVPKELVLELDDLWLGPTSFTLRFPLEPYPAK